MASACPRGGLKGADYAMESLLECWDKLRPPVPPGSLACARSGLAIFVQWGPLLGLSCERWHSVGGARSRVGHGLTHDFQLAEIHLNLGFVHVGWTEPCSPPHRAVPCALSIQV